VAEAQDVAFERVSKVYPGGVCALEEVSLAVEPGTFLVLLGPSGSGKTTLLRSLAGIERITAGRIAIGGRTVADGKVHLPPERRGLSMVFQDYALWPHLTARDNVAFALRRTVRSRAERRLQAEAVLERVGLLHLADRFPNELSGGEQQRVALSRALVGRTGIVLCDEPLSNLDADLRERLRVEIASLVRASGATTVYITHDQAEAFALADRVGVLERGRLVQVGVPEEIYAWPATPFVARFTGLAAELPVRVASRAGEAVAKVVPTGVGCQQPIVARAVEPLLAGPAALLVRPSAVRLVPAERGQVAGVVTDVAFRGRGYEVVIDLGGGARVTNVASEQRLARGEHAGLQFEPAGCLVFGAANGAWPAKELGRQKTAPAAAALRPAEPTRVSSCDSRPASFARGAGS
jgi:iron(III) transport system ATP-binding protein